MSHAQTETYRTSSSEETKKLGYDVGQSLLRAPVKKEGATVFALRGDLGAGKTTFIQGFMQGLGSRKRVTSPTFILMRRHALSSAKKFSNIFHIDAYRLKKPEQFRALEMEDAFKDPKNIILVEWPEQAGNFIPKDVITLSFKYGKKENERTIIIKR